MTPCIPFNVQQVRVKLTKKVNFKERHQDWRSDWEAIVSKFFVGPISHRSSNLFFYMIVILTLTGFIWNLKLRNIFNFQRSYSKKSCWVEGGTYLIKSHIYLKFVLQFKFSVAIFKLTVNLQRAELAWFKTFSISDFWKPFCTNSFLFNIGFVSCNQISWNSIKSTLQEECRERI